MDGRPRGRSGRRAAPAERDLDPLEEAITHLRKDPRLTDEAAGSIRNKKIIVTNPLRSRGRLASDVAHEVSHIMLKHELTEVREVDGVPFRTCRPDEEEQATALGGTLLLPRPLLMVAAKNGEDFDTIAQRCGVTVEMARYRFNTTGVARQAAHWGR